MGFLNELEEEYSQKTSKDGKAAQPANSVEPQKQEGFLAELEKEYKQAPVEQPKSFLSTLEQESDIDPTSLRERQSRGEPLSIEQERVVFDANRSRSVGEQASAMGKGVLTSLSEMVPKAFEGTKEILGATQDLSKQIGIKYLDINPIVPEIAVNYIAGNTAKERKAELEKAAKKEADVVRSLASGAVQAGEEVINEAARGAFFGTPITDLIQEYPAGKFAYETMKAGGPVALASEAIVQNISGKPLVDLQPITKDESFQRSLNRESMRQQEQQEYKDLPERTTAALAKLAESSVGSLLGKSLGVPSDEQFQKDLVQELKNNAITPNENVALLGNLLSPLDPTFVLAGPLAKASSKAFDVVGEAGLRAITKPTIAGVNPLEGLGKVIRFGGEGAQKAARKFSDFLTGSEDSFIGKLADPLVAVTRRPGMMVEGAGRVLRDIGRQIDDAGVRSRMGIIERAGQDARSGDFMRTVFGPGTEKAQAKALKASEKRAKEGEEMGAALPTISKRRAAARTADWVFRQAEAVARYGTSGAAIGTALGLPDIENAEMLGQVATTGAMVGAIGGARLGEKAAKIVDPRVSLKGKIDSILADDPVSRRADEDADIERFRNTASPDIINKANEFGNINSVLQSFDGHIQNLVDQRNQAIARGENDVAAGMDLEIKKANDSKDAVSKMTPDAIKEYQRRVDLTLADALDQAKTTGEAVGLNNIEIKLLSPVEMLAHLRNKWGSTLDNAEYILQSLAGNNDLSDQDQQKLNEARETINQFNSMYQTAMGQRGYAMSDNTYSDSPQHLRPANLKTPSVVINSELVKSQLGNNLYGTLVHEINHALRNFKEVKSMMTPLEEYLFGKKVQNADGTITEISKGIYDDAAIDRMGDYYAELLGGDKWKAGFATEGQYRDYIKEEILAEASGLSSNTANLRADLDSPGQAFIDWAATSNKNTLIGKLRDALGLKGVLLDDMGRISDILGETISPEVLALTRQYQRQLRDYNGSLSQITSANAPEVTISTPELLSSKILQNKYRGLDIWQKEQVLTIKDDEGNVVNEVVVPQSASLNALVGQYRLEGGMLVDENGNKMQIAPEIAAANLPNNTNISVDQRIARNPDGSPKILSNREIQARARKRGAVLKNAIEGAMEDGSTNRLRPVGDNEYAGILSPTQLQAILELPNEIVPTELKRKIAAFNETALRKDGTRMIVEYQAAMKGGKYKALAPKIRDVVPFGFRITKEGNFLATTISVSRIFDKINDWAKPNRNRLNLWNGDTNALWEDIIHVLKNHQKGERGEVGLDIDSDMAMLKKDRINDIFNLFDKATESKNPDRSVSRTRKGQDSIDRVIMGMRMDRVNDFQISKAQKLPVDYGKIKENYMPNVPVEVVQNNVPSEVAEQAPAQEERRPTPFDGITATYNPSSVSRVKPKILSESFNLERGSVGDEVTQLFRDRQDAVSGEYPNTISIKAGEIPSDATKYIEDLFDTYLKDDEVVKINWRDANSQELTDAPQITIEIEDIQSPETPQALSPGAELTASLVASGTSLESFGKGTLIQLAESYRIDIPKDATRGEIIDAINERPQPVAAQTQGDISFMPAAGESKPVPTQEELDAMKARLPKYRIRKTDLEGSDFSIGIYNDQNNYVGQADVNLFRNDGAESMVRINNIEVNSEFQKQGYGEALYREIAKYAQENGATKITGDPATIAAVKSRSRLFDTYSTGKEMGGVYPNAYSKVPSDISFMPSSKVDEAHADLEKRYKAGDEAAIEEAKQLVNERAREAGGIKAWHGTDAEFTDYDMDMAGSNTGGFLPVKGIFFSKDKNHSSHLPEGAENKYRKKAYIFFNNPFIGKNWDDLGKYLGGDIADWDDGRGERGLERLKQLGNDGYILAKGEEILVTDASQIKSADPFTYDDNGKLIPLSQRFNPKSNDIRFMPSSKLDEAHASAIESGDMEEAQRLVDERAREAGYTIGPVYHGTAVKDLRVPVGARGVAAHLTFDKKYADSFAKDAADNYAADYAPEGFDGITYALRVKGNIFDPRKKEDIAKLQEAFGDDTYSKGFSGKTGKLKYLASEATYDELEYPEIQQALKDAGFDGYLDRDYVAQDWGSNIAVFEPENIKSADPATYDDNGKLIPLSQRFDPKSNDIRFMPASKLDETYANAERNGDEKTAQELVIKAAEKAWGSPVIESGKAADVALPDKIERAASLLRARKYRLDQFNGWNDEQIRQHHQDEYEKYIKYVQPVDPNNPTREEIDKGLNLGLIPYIGPNSVEPIVEREIKEKNIAQKEYEDALNDLNNLKGQDLTFTSGKPVTIQSYHATPFGELEGGGFDPERLGTNTKAGSATLAHFMSGSEQTANAYIKGDSLPHKGFLKLNPNEKDELMRYLGEKYEEDVTYGTEQIKKESKDEGLTEEETEEAVDDFLATQNFDNWLEHYPSTAIADDAGDLFNKDYDTDLVDPKLYKLFVHFDNPMVVDQKGSRYREISYYEALKDAQKNGHDGVIFVNTYDGGPRDNIFAVLKGNENKIKSSDPFTYDENGNLIPLSQRFNPSTTKINFMPYSPEFPKTEDGKIDWEGFKVKTQEIAKPLARLSPIGGVNPTDEQK